MIHEHVVDSALLAEAVEVELAQPGLPAAIIFTEAIATRRRIIDRPTATQRVFVGSEARDDVPHLAFRSAGRQEGCQGGHVLSSVDAGLQRVLGAKGGGEEQQGEDETRAGHRAPQEGTESPSLSLCNNLGQRPEARGQRLEVRDQRPKSNDSRFTCRGIEAWKRQRLEAAVSGVSKQSIRK